MSNNLAFVFPGQGSQTVGMLTDYAEQFPELLAWFEQASDVLSYDLWQLVQQGPAEKLNQTEYTQPALFVASYALWQLWLEQGGSKPTLLAGHSLGEYTALACADVLEFPQMLKVVQHRAKLMQQAVPAGQGALAAIIGLAVEKIVVICDELQEKGFLVTPANFNSPLQTVVAGDKAGVEQVMAEAKAAGAKRTLLLPVSVPSHSPLMQEITDDYLEVLNQFKFNAPSIPVIHNVDIQSHSVETDLKHALVSQLYSPVRWVETVQRLVASGITKVIECGPGNILTGLNKRIDNQIQLASLGSLTGFETELNIHKCNV